MLGICLGLQLALDVTEEDGGVDGLGLVPGRAVRLTRRSRAADRAGPRSASSAPSTSRTPTPRSTPCATAWSEGVVAEVRNGSFIGVQFHPEKSGAAGARYLEEQVRCLSLA